MTHILRRVVVTVTVGFALTALLATVAGAKGISQIAVCGANGCKDVTRTSSEGDVGFPMGDVIDPPSASAPFVRVVVTVSAPPAETGGKEEVLQRSSYLYVPSLRIMRTARNRHGDLVPTWQNANPLTVQALQTALYGVKRYPAQRLDQIGHMEKVTLPEKLGSVPTVTREPEMTIHYLPKPKQDDGVATGWWIGGGAAAAAVIAALALVLLRRRRASGGASGVPAT